MIFSGFICYCFVWYFSLSLMQFCLYKYVWSKITKTTTTNKSGKKKTSLNSLSRLQNELKDLFTYIHAYIHNWSLQPLFSLLRSFSWQLYLATEFLPEICWKEVAVEIFSYFRFDVWPGVWTRVLHLISQHNSY